MDLSLDSIKKDAGNAIDWVGNHDKELLIGAGAVAAGAAALYLTKGEALLGEGGALSRVLPSLGIGGVREAEVVAADALPNMMRASLTKQTFSEKVTELVLKNSTKAAKAVVDTVKGAESGEVAAVSDDTRRHVFNRFLSRLDQERYVLHGSYPLESQSYIARPATKDLDLLITDKSLVKGTRAATDEALLKDLQSMAGKDMGDGLTFHIDKLDKSPVHLVWSRMRHATAIAMEGDKEVMRLTLDMRVGANTILPATEQTMKGAAGDAAMTYRSMQPEENAAFKMFTYTNRTIGGLGRKAKDLGDVASMLKKGLDEEKVTQAMSAFAEQGYTPGAMRHPAEVMGSLLERKPELMAGQTPAQLDENYQIVRNFYERIAPKVFSTPLKEEVSTSWASRLHRFWEKQLTIYPAG